MIDVQYFDADSRDGQKGRANFEEVQLACFSWSTRARDSISHHEHHRVVVLEMNLFVSLFLGVLCGVYWFCIFIISASTQALPVAGWSWMS